MTISDFISYVKQLENRELDFDSIDQGIIHGTLGIAGEAGELVDSIKKCIVYKAPLDKNNIKEELGDILHYAAYIIYNMGWTFEEVMQANKEKLDVRYPNGYSNDAALRRADKHAI